MKGKHYNLIRILIVVMAVLFVVFGTKFATTLLDRAEVKESSSWSAPERSTAPTLGTKEEYNGKKYRLNSSISTVLFLGTDYGEHEEGVLGSGARSDTIILFVLDDESKTIKALLIPRDTMVSVDLYEANGDYAMSVSGQITLQYGSGDSPARSCYLTKKKVSELLYGIRIDDTFAFYAAGIVPVVDSLGGLTITLHDDYTDIDPSYTEGATVTLSGEEMEAFVRTRDIEVSESNIVRINRHFDLLRNAFSQMGGSGKIDLEDLVDKASQYVQSDVDADTLKKLSAYKFIEESIMLPGHTVKGEYHDEYYVDEEALKGILIELFYQER
jgi:LCP family protein required for cell wall assembly